MDGHEYCPPLKRRGSVTTEVDSSSDEIEERKRLFAEVDELRRQNKQLEGKTMRQQELILNFYRNDSRVQLEVIRTNESAIQRNREQDAQYQRLTQQLKKANERAEENHRNYTAMKQDRDHHSEQAANWQKIAMEAQNQLAHLRCSRRLSNEKPQ
ncbi:unnamed protein product, partial [Mesorhabditis spiculigera]